jgi:cation transport protein ChaC
VSGIAFKIPAAKAPSELDMLWRREMLNNSYNPRFVTIHTSEGKKQALTFVIKRSSPAFADKMSDERASEIIARASGFVGPCAQYLLETEKALCDVGIADKHMSKLASMVKKKMAAIARD